MAFRRPKLLWHSFLDQVDIQTINLDYHAAGCCVLHNIRETHEDISNREWLQDDLDLHDNYEV